MPIVREDRSTTELSRRRVYLFLLVFVVLALLATIGEESYMLIHAFDDYMLVAIAVISIAIILLSWKRKLVSQLSKQHNIITALFIIALIIQIYAIVVELNDPADFGNEIPSLILIIFVLANRFV